MSVSEFQYFLDQSKPVIMGVINSSPNSFYCPTDSILAALHKVDAMVAAGAAIIDVGGEATNPNVIIERDAPSIQQELDRVIPVIEAITQRFDILVSVDTSEAAIMREAVAAGAGMINDQRALVREGALQAALELAVPICLMHFFTSSRLWKRPDYERLLLQVYQELKQAINRCETAGILRSRLLIDPGFGQGNYGKSCDENYYLLAHLNRFQALGLPILVGWSRKSMIGDVLKAPPEDRLYGSMAAAVIAAMQGASVIRVHDVKETMDAIKIFKAVARFIEKA